MSLKTQTTAKASTVFKSVSTSCLVYIIMLLFVDVAVNTKKWNLIYLMDNLIPDYNISRK